MTRRQLQVRVKTDLEVGTPAEILHYGLFTGAMGLLLHHIFLGNEGVLPTPSSRAAEPEKRNRLQREVKKNGAGQTIAAACQNSMG